MTKDPLIQSYWQAFLASDSPPPPGASYLAWAFGDSPEMADELLALVQAGTKTATASLHWVYEVENEALPQVGEYNIILDGAGRPGCITQTVEVRILPFDQVPADFGRDEGEGDLSLTFWRRVHWDFFTRECASIGRQPAEDMPVVCERFRLVYRG
ncbi:MAG: ASCH domain-containing protein [Anaerolineae bacterium]|nr:ASCH domain-containing protein [Anaerolineae bacterium]